LSWDKDSDGNGDSDEEVEEKANYVRLFRIRNPHGALPEKATDG
jgi:hypothetical protein